jgi:transcriptional regulator with XRE-family HTH domain
MKKKAIGQQIKKEMDIRKWSVYKLAQESGIPITPIQSIIKGSANYTIDTLLEVCLALGISTLSIPQK